MNIRRLQDALLPRGHPLALSVLLARRHVVRDQHLRAQQHRVRGRRRLRRPRPPAEPRRVRGRARPVVRLQLPVPRRVLAAAAELGPRPQRGDLRLEAPDKVRKGRHAAYEDGRVVLGDTGGKGDFLLANLTLPMGLMGVQERTRRWLSGLDAM